MLNIDRKTRLLNAYFNICIYVQNGFVIEHLRIHAHIPRSHQRDANESILS